MYLLGTQISPGPGHHISLSHAGSRIAHRHTAYRYCTDIVTRQRSMLMLVICGKVRERGKDTLIASRLTETECSAATTAEAA